MDSASFQFVFFGLAVAVLSNLSRSRAWQIDTCLMSCRVLGRKVEHMLLGHLLQQARAAGITRITGSYIPTDRNKLVVDHYAKLGFTKVAEEETGLTRGEVLVAEAKPDIAPMKVVTLGFATSTEKTTA